jgi:integrin-linked kinase-associated serine/threonine phosphatase 2C
VIGSDGLWDHMTSAEVCGFVLQCENREKAAEDLVLEARGRWEEANKNKKGSSKIGDVPTM